MNVVVKTDGESTRVSSVEELTLVLTEVLTDKDKASNLARDIMEVAAARPEDVPPLIINLNKEE